jgi:hypothetical protein
MDAMTLRKDDKLFEEAKKRFTRCEEWEGDYRKLFVEDLRFANADADNGFQWPDSVRKNREIDDRPCLTINKTKQHCFQVINDAKQNKPAIHVHPVNNGATVEAAKLLDGIVRHVEYNSEAQTAYDTATEHQVMGGIGYWRVTTDYASEDSFDQEIYIRRVKDPMSVYLDPDIREADGSDATFGFIFDDLTKDEFEAKYGEDAAKTINFPIEGGTSWIKPDHIRIAEYFRKVPANTELMAVPMEILDARDETGQPIVPPEAADKIIRNKGIALKSDFAEAHWQLLDDAPGTKKRTVEQYKVKWYLLAGDGTILDEADWPGKYIPIVRVVGEEVIIDGKLERKGHTRALKDPQRMYNYWSSSATEQVALQSKTPYVGSARAFEGYEDYWATANNTNRAYLPYNDIDETGQAAIERPQRAEPPVMAQAYMQGLQIAANEMMMVSGQYQAVMGQQSNETSGVAINERQRQGDNATYHYIDNLARAIRFTGRIILDLIPHIYDTERVMRILGEDGVEDFIHINPDQQAAMQQQQQQVQKEGQIKQEVRYILNPKIGKYDVVVDIGPSYSTRRQEAFQNLSQIMAHNPQLMQMAGDLLFKAADFPMAQDVAERLNRAIPPNLKGESPDPHVQQLMMQNQQLQQAMQHLTSALAAMKDKQDAGMMKAQADQYRAETERAQFIHDAATDQTRLGHDLAMATTQMMQPPQPIQQ